MIPAGELAGRPAIPLTRPIIVAGSRNNCRLHLISRTVSKAHALIVVTRHSVFVRDLASREGTFVNGEKIGERDLAEGDILKIGRFEFIFSTGGARLKPHREKAAPPAIIRQLDSEVLPVPLEGRVSLIGRRGSADIAFVEQSVSTAHAVVVAWEGKRYVRDLGSRTGTFVNGKQVHQQEITPGDQIRIGESDLVYEVSEEGAGVEVVASPTESAVAAAISAQEIETVALSADDTAAPAEKPKVAAPAARIARPASPVLLEDSIAGEAAADEPKPPTVPGGPVSRSARPAAAIAENPLADSIAGIAIDDATGPAATADTLSRRGWHRGASEPALDTPAADALLEKAPITPFDLTAAPPAEPVADEMPSGEVESARAELPQLVEEPLMSMAEVAQVDSVAQAVETDIDDVLGLVEDTAPATPPAEVIESTDADAAQPLEAVAPEVADPLPADTHGAEALTDTMFNREVKALTDTRLGEPVEVPADQIAAEPASTDESSSPAAEEMTATGALPIEMDSPEATTHEPEPIVEEIAPAIDLTDLAGELEPASVGVAPVPGLQFRAPVTPVADLSPAEPIELEPPPTEAAVEVEALEQLPIEAVAQELPESVVEPAAALPLEELAADAANVAAFVTADVSSEQLSIDSPTGEASAVATVAGVDHEDTAPLAMADVSSDPAIVADSDTVAATISLPAGPAAEATSISEPVEPPTVEPLAINLEAATEPWSEVQLQPLAETAIGDLLAGEGLAEPPASDQPAVDASTEASDEPIEPLPLSAAPQAVAANELLAIEDLVDIDDGPAPTPVQLADDAGVTSVSGVAHETAFAVVVPPLPLGETTAATVLPESQSASVATGVTEAVQISIVEPPQPATDDVGSDSSSEEAAPIALTEPPAADPAADALPVIEPPPMPLNAPPVTPVADSEDEPGILIAPRPRRPAVIRDGLNRRGRRSVGDSSPFAGATGAIDVPDAFGSALPGDAFSTPSPAGIEAGVESVAPPSEIVLPAEEPSGVELAATDSSAQASPQRGHRPRDPHSIRRPRPEAPSFGPDIGVPMAVVAEESAADLHELRRRRLRWIPTLLITAVLLGAGSMGAIWKMFPVVSEFETALKFSNFEALTIREQQDLQQEQVRLLRLDVTRQKSLESLRSNTPQLASGFLGSTVGFDRVIMLSGWPENRQGEFVIRYRGDESGDRERVHAVAQAMYLWNIKRNDNTTRVRAALRDAQDKLDANNRKLADLRAEIEKERILGESRPRPGEVERLETAVLEAEKRWTEALANLKEAQAEEARIDKLLHNAQDNPPPPPEQDAELASLTEQLTAIQAEYKAFQTRQSEQAAVARGEIDAAMDSFQRQIEAARGQGADSPELTQYIAAAENLQKTARELVDEMIDRQQKQYQQLSELKASLDEKARQRAVELRNSDPQLKEFYEKRELYRRQVNAAIGSGLDKKDFENVEDQLKLTENMIKSREDLLSSDPLHVETITRLQAMIDGMQADIVADRKKADEKMEELQKSFAASAPTVASLPAEQRKLAEQVREQLGGIALARKRYADIVEADRIAAEAKLNDMQGRIVVLQGEVESRKKLLADEFASKSVTALTASLEAQRKLLADAQSAEAVARAEFESQGKALRQARDTLALLQNSDERMSRLIAERETTEGLVATFNRDLNFRLEESKRQVEVIVPPLEAVLVNRSEDRRPMYTWWAVGSILALTAAGVFWTLHSANRLDFAFPARAPESPSPRPAPEKPVDSSAGEDTPTAIA